jgi:hypothetical protein
MDGVIQPKQASQTKHTAAPPLLHSSCLRVLSRLYIGPLIQMYFYLITELDGHYNIAHNYKVVKQSNSKMYVAYFKIIVMLSLGPVVAESIRRDIALNTNKKRETSRTIISDIAMHLSTYRWTEDG